MARESLGTIAPPLFANVQRSPRLDLAGMTLEAIEDFAGFVKELASVPPTAPIGTKVVHGTRAVLPPDPDDGRDFNYNDYGYPIPPKEVAQ